MSSLQNSRALVSPSYTLRLCWSPPSMSWMFFLLHHCACMLGHFSGVQICDPMDCSPPGSSVHGILQVRILEWVATPSRGSFWPKDWTPHLLRLLHWQVGSLPLAPPGKPLASLVSPGIKHALETESTPLQYSCLENPMDGGAWWAAVHGVAQSLTRLKWLSSSSSSRDRETESISHRTRLQTNK